VPPKIRVRLGVGDDHFYRSPTSDHARPMLEAYTLLAAIAAKYEARPASERYGDGGVTYRNPAYLAKVETTLDVISSGRAILGIGRGLERRRATQVTVSVSRQSPERMEASRGSPQMQGHVHRRGSQLHRAATIPLRARASTGPGRSGPGHSGSSSAAAANGRLCGWWRCMRRLQPLRATWGLNPPQARRCWIGHCEAIGRDPAEITKTPSRRARHSGDQRRG